MRELTDFACHAAIELDNLRLRRSELTFVNVFKVRDWIQPLTIDVNVQGGYMFDSQALWHVYCAMLHPYLDPPVDLRSTGQLATMAVRTVQCLNKLLKNPARFASEHRAALESLINFCVELSRKSSARQEDPICRLCA